MNAELSSLRKSSEKAEGVEKKKLESDIEQLFPKIQQLGSELKIAKEVSKSKFEFNLQQSWLNQKGGKKSHKFLGDTQKSRLIQRFQKKVYRKMELFSKTLESAILRLVTGVMLSKVVKTQSA